MVLSATVVVWGGLNGATIFPQETGHMRYPSGKPHLKADASDTEKGMGEDIVYVAMEISGFAVDVCG